MSGEARQHGGWLCLCESCALHCISALVYVPAAPKRFNTSSKAKRFEVMDFAVGGSLSSETKLTSAAILDFLFIVARLF